MGFFEPVGGGKIALRCRFDDDAWSLLDRVKHTDPAQWVPETSWATHLKTCQENRSRGAIGTDKACAEKSPLHLTSSRKKEIVVISKKNAAKARLPASGVRVVFDCEGLHLQVRDDISLSLLKQALNYIATYPEFASVYKEAMFALSPFRAVVQYCDPTGAHVRQGPLIHTMEWVRKNGINTDTWSPSSYLPPPGYYAESCIPSMSKGRGTKPSPIKDSSQDPRYASYVDYVRSDNEISFRLAKAGCQTHEVSEDEDLDIFTKEDYSSNECKELNKEFSKFHSEAGMLAPSAHGSLPVEAFQERMARLEARSDEEELSGLSRAMSSSLEGLGPEILAKFERYCSGDRLCTCFGRYKGRRPANLQEHFSTEIMVTASRIAGSGKSPGLLKACRELRQTEDCKGAAIWCPAGPKGPKSRSSD